MHTLIARDRRLPLDAPVVMGILNVTPDSFSDGGLYVDPDRALVRARQLVADGAAIVDVGGESTRPRAAPVSAAEEMARVVPVIERIARELDVLISIDTSDPDVIRAAVAAGAGLVNDVRGLRRPGALEAAAASGAAVCVMHMQGEPADMQENPTYVDVVDDIIAYLRGRVAACVALGMEPASVLVDPGFGFGKNLAHHLALFNRLEAFRGIGGGLLVGLSRKSLLGALTGRPVGDRLAAGVAAAAIAVSRGADIVRTHDVGPTRDAVQIGAALRRTREWSA